MPYQGTLEHAKSDYPEYTCVSSLTQSEQKAAFHVRNSAGEDLCLKIINPNCRLDYLEREILGLQSIAHRNVARLREYVYSSKDGQLKHYIVEDFIEGEDLSQSFASANMWSRAKASVFFSALCDGLEAMRRENIVHRDLKPSNIRVRSDGSPVIIDLGVARHLDLPDITNTSDGAAIGTPMYFAPEQFTGTKHDIKHQTDLFAVGILIHQALIGRHPFVEEEFSLQDAVCISNNYQQSEAYIALPKTWKLLINRLLAKDIINRPHNAGQVADILCKIGEE